MDDRMPELRRARAVLVALEAVVEVPVRLGGGLARHPAPHADPEALPPGILDVEVPDLGAGVAEAQSLEASECTGLHPAAAHRRREVRALQVDREVLERGAGPAAASVGDPVAAS